MKRILIVEDEDRIASFVEKGLRQTGFIATIISDGLAGYEEASTGRYDLMVLDVGLPLLDGFQVLEQLRKNGHDLPVIMLTARDAVEDRVHGLSHGADDYIIKPFAFEELLARIQLRLPDGAGADQESMTVAGLTLDLRTRRVTRENGTEIDLSAREFALAEMFFEHPDQVLTREQLLSNVWGMDFDPGSNVVDVYVRYLRRKLGDGYIETVRGMGYRFHK